MIPEIVFESFFAKEHPSESDLLTTHISLVFLKFQTPRFRLIFLFKKRPYFKLSFETASYPPTIVIKGFLKILEIARGIVV